MPVTHATPAVVASPFAHELPPLNLRECPEPSAASFATAQALERTPDDPYYQTAFRQVYSQQSDAIAQIIDEDVERHVHLRPGETYEALAYQQFDGTIEGVSGSETIAWLDREHAAQITGVELHDPRPYVLPLEQDLRNGGEMPFEEYLTAAQAYLRLFGVKLELAGANPKAAGLPDDMKAPTLGDLNNYTAKDDIVSLIKAFASMPQQYIDLADTKYVYIGTNANPKKGSHAAAYTAVDGPHDIVVMNFGYGDGPDVFDHETIHDVAAAVCGGVGGMYNDPSFSEYNTHPYDSTDKGLTYQNFWDLDTVKAETSQEIEFDKENKFNQAMPIESKIDSELKEVSYLTNYSQTNVAEDEAETGKAMSSGMWTGVLGSRTPFIRDKFTVLLARVSTYLPNVARYFALTSMKSFSSSK